MFDKQEYLDRLHKAADYIEAKCGKAEIAVVLGSGLGDYVEELADTVALPYAEIPGFPVSTAPGHAGKLWCGTIHGKKTFMLQGRFHFYEGYELTTVTLYVYVLRLLGVKTLILTNAAGGVNTSFSSGALMVIDDHINMAGHNPLTGPHLEEFGPRFNDMSYAYTPALRKLAADVAAEKNIALAHGVYAWMNGPSYETPAEIRMLRIMGADAVGMSTVPEAIVASNCGMQVLGVSCITNMAAGILDQPLSHLEVMETGERVKGIFRSLIDGVVEKL